MTSQDIKADCLYLFSSNSQRTYFINALWFLMAPPGMIIHLRYERQYLDNYLNDQLDLSTSTPSVLIGKQVLLCYLFQTKVVSEQGEAKGADVTWQPHKRYPFRFGNVEDAFVQGKVAHFYIVVDHYPAATHLESITNELGVMLGKVEDQKHHAFITERLDQAHICANPDKYSSSFQSIVDGLDRSHLRSSGRNEVGRAYDPLFVRIDAPRLVEKTGSGISFTASVRNFQSKQRGYQIGRNYDCLVPVEVYQPRWSAVPERNCKLLVQTDGRRFSLVKERQISSRYDRFEIFLRPILEDQDWFGPLTIAPSMGAESDIGSEIVGATWDCWLELPPKHVPILAYCSDAVGIVALWWLGFLSSEFAHKEIDALWLALGVLAVFVALVVRRAVSGRA